MTNTNPYLSSRILTADRGQILLMLYDGALRFGHQGVELLEAGKRVEALGPMRRTLAIVQELVAVLDPRVSPEICANLERLYGFVLDRILEAQLEGQAHHLRDALRVLANLRETWALAIEQARQEPQPVEKTG